MSAPPKIKDLYTSLVNEVSKDAQGFHPLQQLAAKIHQPPGIIILLVILISINLTVFHIATDFIMLLLGSAYPIYMSLVTEQDKEESRIKWLTYWVLFGFLIFFNPVIKLFIFFVPFYSLLRLFVVIGLFYPRNEYTMKLHRILMMARSKCKTLVEEKMKSLM